MSRVSTLRDRVREIRRKFKHVNSFRYFYNNKRDLQRRIHRVKIWFLIHDMEKGYSIFPMEFKRAMSMSVESWRKLFTKQITIGGKTYDPIFPIFVLKVLPAINVRNASEWKFKTVIGWTGWNDIRQTRHSNTRKKRHSTAKKRNANARRRNRGG